MRWDLDVSAGLENRHHELGDGPTLRGGHLDGKAAAVVLDGDGVVAVDGDAGPAASNWRVA